MISPIVNYFSSKVQNALKSSYILSKSFGNHKINDSLSSDYHGKNNALNIHSLREKTKEATKAFVKRSSLYATLNLLHKSCNSENTTQEDDNKILLIVKNFSNKKVHWWSSLGAMKKHFPNLSYVKMFILYFAFIGWVPEIYIQSFVDKILSFSRKKADDLPFIGNSILSLLNTYFSNYIRATERFRDDKESPIGERDKYIRKELKRKEILGYDSTEKLYNKFASSASSEDIRPCFRVFSNPINKFQKLDYNFLKGFGSIFKVFLPLTYAIGLIPYYVARVLEFIPNIIIKIAHSSLLEQILPTVIDNTLESVSKPEFSHAINEFLCELVEDALSEMKKSPEEKDIQDVPNVITGKLDLDIKKFSKLLYNLLKNEPYKSQEELKILKKNGSKKTFLESFLIMIGAIESDFTETTFIEALQTNLTDLFKTLFAKPEKLEEYLNLLLNVTNKAFDYVPTVNTEEGKAQIEKMKATQRKRIKLIDNLIQKSIGIAVDDFANTKVEMLSKHQKENIIIYYRRIKKKAEEKLPVLISLAYDLKKVFSNPDITKSQAKKAKEIIDKTTTEIERLQLSIENVMCEENGVVKKQMKNTLRSFLSIEDALKKNINGLDDLYHHTQNLKALNLELDKFKKTFNSFYLKTNSFIDNIKKHMRNLKKINSNQNLSSIIKKFETNIENQLIKIKAHLSYKESIEKILTNSYFSNSLIFSLSKAKKHNLLKKNIYTKTALKKEKDKIFAILEEIKPFNYNIDFNEITEAINDILNTQNLSEVNEKHKKCVSLLKLKLKKHKYLFNEENSVLPNYFKRCKSLIDLELSNIPKYKEETSFKIISQLNLLETSLSKMEIETENIDKKKSWYQVVNIKDISNKIARTSIFSIPTLALNYFGLSSWYIRSSFLLPFSALFYENIKRFTYSQAGVEIMEGPVNEKAKSAVNTSLNPTFYEGLIHDAMKLFIKRKI